METPIATNDVASAQALSAEDSANILKIQTLLKAKDDTQRFVGLALLKSILDNSPHLRQDQHVIQALWASLPAKFLDRLLRTGSSSSSRDAKDMLDLAVSVLHTFVVLLPDEAKLQPKFVERIPRLVAAVLQSSDETTNLLLQLLYTLVSSQEGAKTFTAIEDLSPLTEIAPSHPLVLDILCHAWLNAMVSQDKSILATRIDNTIQSLVSSFTGTDAVTLLEFIGKFLRQADVAIIPPNPAWLKTVVTYIQNLVTSRPTPEARSAYTNAAASLLQAFPFQAPELLFSDKKKDEKPFAYLLINLLLIDIRSSVPMLLEQLNKPDYPTTSRRLSSAFDVVCIFIGYLVRSLEDESLDSLVMSPDNLLKLRKGISETMSVTIEYLRDRWDASVAGAMGLHPDARTGPAETSMGSRYTLAWDSMKNNADDDPFTLSAVRALALWLREDENDLLRKEATGLTDMLMDLYRSSSPETLDFRSSVLVALEALVTLEQGREILLNNGGWEIITRDLVSVLQNISRAGLEDVSRGIEAVRVLLAVAEQVNTGTAEAWMDIITTVSAWNIPDQEQTPLSQEFQVAVLQLCCTVLANANPGMRKRYAHSIRAIAGVAHQLSSRLANDSPLAEAMADVLSTLDELGSTV
ncbi:Neurochondrin-domain-containing protein [Stachybotrys elegans]|uniref:Neurochondrin-domain-containing protein n=1 Tax=Stachybotrys elegans TaxID=80388 RepID=A0A8K0SRN8_9HYPO|nr:Neurochondrin-domain-containing protein [Stachybotrys elegans]